MGTLEILPSFWESPLAGRSLGLEYDEILTSGVFSWMVSLSRAVSNRTPQIVGVSMHSMYIEG